LAGLIGTRNPNLRRSGNPGFPEVTAIADWWYGP